MQDGTKEYTKVVHAVVDFDSPEGRGPPPHPLHGTVNFSQEGGPGNPTLIRASIWGLLPNHVHAFHIHEYGDDAHMALGCAGLGGHFNPHGKEHGSYKLDGKNRHVGDLVNNLPESTADGFSSVAFYDDLVDLSGDNSVIGRSIVVHDGQDDLGRGGDAESLKSGNAGHRRGCGRIKLLS